MMADETQDQQRSRKQSRTDLGSKLSFSRLKDSLKSRPSTSRRAEESVVEEGEIIGSDGHMPLLPRLNMPDFTPFDSTTLPPLGHRESSSTQTAQPSRLPDGIDGAQEGQLLNTPSNNNMSATATLVESSPAPATDGSPWIGGTGLGSASLGKSGRVIEKLMAENDRLRREMKAEIAKREELQRAAQTQKPRLEALQAENARLSHCKAVDESVIKRRDRKIEDLKAELDVERQKRGALEHRAADAERKMEEYEEHSNKEVQLAIEQAKHATTHASVLETSHRQLSSEYRQRIATVSKQLRELNEDKEDDRKRLVKLDVVNHQMRQEAEKARKVYGELLSVWDKYNEEKESEVNRIRDDLSSLKQGYEKRESESQKTLDEMHEIMDRMKWLMAFHKVVNENGVSSPPPSPHN